MFYGIPANRIQDMQRALATIEDIYQGNFYCNDMLVCLGRNLSFQQDQKFMASFTAAATCDQERSLLWRLHTLAWAAKSALAVEGDYVECGVYKGFCSDVLLRCLDFGLLPRHAFLYDTFAGLPEQTSTEDERRNWDYTSQNPDELYAKVCAKFAGYKNVTIVRGIVPDSFKQAMPDKIAFLHIDMNSEQAELLALESLFDKVTPGGMIVLDDFGWKCNANQTSTELAFMHARGHHILELPTGQGVVLKHALPPSPTGGDRTGSK